MGVQTDIYLYESSRAPKPKEAMIKVAPAQQEVLLNISELSVKQ